MRANRTCFAVYRSTCITWLHLSTSGLGAVHRIQSSLDPLIGQNCILRRWSVVLSLTLLEKSPAVGIRQSYLPLWVQVIAYKNASLYGIECDIGAASIIFCSHRGYICSVGEIVSLIPLPKYQRSIPSSKVF